MKASEKNVPLGISVSQIDHDRFKRLCMDAESLRMATRPRDPKIHQGDVFKEMLDLYERKEGDYEA